MNARPYSFEQLCELAGQLCVSGQRHILGITGSPGAGKSTLAARLVAHLGDQAVLLPMDGYHLSNRVLIERGLRQHKGGQDTFDTSGYLTMLARIRHQSVHDGAIYAPAFHREIEESISAEIVVPPQVPLVISEGNYILCQVGAWASVADFFDEVWFLDLNMDVRVDRLVRRHVDFGKSPDEAIEWSMGSDQRNAELIESTRHRATRIICLSD